MARLAISPLKEIRLSEIQEKVKEEIYDHFQEKSTVLLHGVTGSGKTEIYIEMIKDAIANGTQALYLLPEIALTAQIVNRLQAVFGDRIGIFHSKFSDNERVEVWYGFNARAFRFHSRCAFSHLLAISASRPDIIDEELAA